MHAQSAVLPGEPLRFLGHRRRPTTDDFVTSPCELETARLTAVIAYRRAARMGVRERPIAQGLAQQLRRDPKGERRQQGKGAQRTKKASRVTTVRIEGVVLGVSCVVLGVLCVVLGVLCVVLGVL